MHDAPARPIDLHCQGLLPWADPYIVQLVQRYQRENPGDRRFDPDDRSRRKSCESCQGSEGVRVPFGAGQDALSPCETRAGFAA